MHLGDGTFGRVVSAKTKDGQVVAIKIIKPVRRYIKSAWVFHSQYVR